MLFLGVLLSIGIARAGVIEVLDPAMNAVVDPREDLKVVARGQTWTEGPLELADGRLMFADIKTNSIRAVDQAGHVAILKSPSGYSDPKPFGGPEPGSSAMAFDAAGGVIVAGHAGRALFRYRTTPGARVKRETLVDRFEGRRLNSPNDLALARDGSIYFTDPPFGLPRQSMDDPQRELDGASVFRLKNPGRPDQKLVRLTRELDSPNGLAFTPDQKELIVANTKTKTWVAFPVKADGSLGASRVFASAQGDERPGEPDGLKVDHAGRVFAAAPGGVWVFDKSGRRLGTIRVPERTTNVAFGGKDRRTLFVTAGAYIYKIRLKTGP